MDVLSNLYMGFSIALTPINILYCLAGVFFGQIVGVLPGIGAPTAIALLLPLTFSMNPTSALIMFAGIYYGVAYGGTITSVLINVPGESSTVMTCLDGYQMALKGRAGAALSVAAIGSWIAGTVSVVILMALHRPWPTLPCGSDRPNTFALAFMAFGLLTVFGGGSSLSKPSSLHCSVFCIATDRARCGERAPPVCLWRPSTPRGFDFIVIICGIFGVG